ncbi:MAG: multidrug efflux SMR transporter [Actinomycetota bacterium]|nr:multidrug efflux SMR transporter [Actinomycetota bacterium]
MPYLLLLPAISSEVIGTLSLKASDGFTRLWPSVVVVVGYGLAFTLLAQTLKSLGVGPTYATWSALGTVGAALGGWLIFGEKMSPLSIGGMGIVIAGIVIMQWGSVTR